MMSNTELAMELMSNQQIYFGKLDDSIIIANGPIDFDSGYGWRINAQTGKTENADTIYAKDTGKMFRMGMILKHESTVLQFITAEQIEGLLNSGELKHDEALEFLEKTKAFDKYYADAYVFD